MAGLTGMHTNISCYLTPTQGYRRERRVGKGDWPAHTLQYTNSQSPPKVGTHVVENWFGVVKLHGQTSWACTYVSGSQQQVITPSGKQLLKEGVAHIVRWTMGSRRGSQLQATISRKVLSTVLGHGAAGVPLPNWFSVSFSKGLGQPFQEVPIQHKEGGVTSLFPIIIPLWFLGLLVVFGP